MSEIAPNGTPLLFDGSPSRGTDMSTREHTAKYLIRRIGANIAFPDFSERQKLHKKFDRPIEWGYHHLNRAMNNGVVMFWFPKQNSRSESKSTHLYDHPYGINAERTLGLCLGAKKHNDRVRVVVGAHPNYDRVQSLEDLLKHWGSGLTLQVGSLQDTCDTVIKLLGK